MTTADNPGKLSENSSNRRLQRIIADSREKPQISKNKLTDIKEKP
jgi:hypothetical protein